MQKQFKSLSFRPVPLIAAALAAMLVLVLASAALAQTSDNSLVFPPTDEPFGISYTDWSVAWWQWALALDVDGHPFMSDGFHCNSADNGQAGPVWFLALSPLPESGSAVERRCSIPADTPLFIGLANVECSDLENLGEKEGQQRHCAKSFANHIVVSSLFCTIDGQAVANLGSFRFLSPQFTFSAPTPWIFGNTGGIGTAVSDGYFLMLKPLSNGPHTLSCGGAFDFGGGAVFEFGNIYNLQ